MAPIIALDRATERFVRRAGQAGPDYEAGVRNPRRNWAEAAVAAEPAYRDGVTQAAQAGRFGRGVRRAGNQKWQQRAIELGVPRFPTGVAAAADEWTRGFAPFHQAISAVQLAPRRPKRDPANRQRINQILDAVTNAAIQRDRTGG
ncbi:MAG: hypothetical protein ACE5IP_11940 [Terriglobia bacterium]